MEGAGRAQIRTDFDAVEVVRAERSWQAVDGNVLEPVGRVARFERLAVADEDHRVDLVERKQDTRAHVRTQMVGRDVTVGVEGLAMGQHDLRPGTCLVKVDPAARVLAEVDDVPPALERRHRHRRDRPDAANRRCRGRAQAAPVGAQRIRRLEYRLPVAAIPAEAVRPLHHPLSVEQVGLRRVGDGGAPAEAGTDDGRGTVGVDDFELGEERRAVTEVVVGTAVAEQAAVPAVGEKCAQVVRAFVQHGGQVVGLHLKVRPVGGEARGELLVADPLTVDHQLVDAVGCDVGPGRGDRPGQFHMRVQGVDGPMTGVGHVLLMGPDPGSRPVAPLQQPHLPERRSRPVALAEVGPHAHPPLDAFAGGRLRARVRDQYALGGSHDAGRPLARRYLVRRLTRGTDGQLPRQTWAGDIRAQDGVVKVLEAQPVWCVGRCLLSHEGLRCSDNVLGHTRFL